MPPPEPVGRLRSLAGRLLLWHAVAVLGVLLALGLVVDRFLQQHLSDSPLRTVRVMLVVGFGLAILAGVLALAAIARGLSGRMRTIVVSVDSVAQGDLSVDAPEEGADELFLLARKVNRMRAEVAARVAELETDREAREAILSALDEGIVLFDRTGRVLYQNDAASRLLEGRIDEARALMPHALRELVDAAAGGGDSETSDIATASPGRVLRASSRTLPGRGSVLLVLRDVTEAGRIEAVRRDFVANASHELKTPAAAIQALAETIVSAAGDDPPSVSRFAGQLEREARRLSRVIADLLDLSRLEGEAGRRSAVRFDRLAASEAERYRRRAERAGVSLEVTTDGAVSVDGSARDLGLMVRNLVENAIQYTRPGGSVKVSVGVDDAGQAVLEVRDSGMGIPSRDQDRVFERFYRVDRARSRETGGTGLGLSIVKHVAENHGGSVSVDSELGRGSSFVVRLPLAEAT